MDTKNILFDIHTEYYLFQYRFPQEDLTSNVSFINRSQPQLITMKVAVLYSGGKDSTFAVDYCLSRGWDIQYLLSVKPTRTDCYLFHYATVEHTPVQAKELGLNHKIITCSVADPKEEAALVKKAVLEMPKVDAVVLGGTGLQETQLRSVQEALRSENIEVFAAHAGQDHDQVMLQMLERGFKYMITQIASDGLTEKDLGLVLTKDNIQDFFARSKKYGFHVGGEGGYFDTYCIEAPIFKNKIEIVKSHVQMESECVGHLIVDEIKTTPKVTQEDIQLV